MERIVVDEDKSFDGLLCKKKSPTITCQVVQLTRKVARTDRRFTTQLKAVFAINRRDKNTQFDRSVVYRRSTDKL